MSHPYQLEKDYVRRGLDLKEIEKDEANLERAGRTQRSECVESSSWKPTAREWLLIGSLSFISLVVSLDATILVTLLPNIADALRGSSTEAFWIGTSYLLASAVLQPVIATISESFGRQQLLVLSLAFFTLGTLMCALARDFSLMLAGRSMQGAGSGGVTAMTQMIFCDVVPLRQRPRYFSAVLVAWSVGSILGPVTGGLLVQRLSWRWCFYISFPFCGVGLLSVVFLVRFCPVEDATLAQKIKRVDWVGATLFVGGLTTLLVGVSWGGVQFPWKSAAAWAPIAAGGLTMLFFGARRRYSGQPNSFLAAIQSSRSIGVAFYCAFSNGLILFTALYYLPLYQMLVLDVAPVRAGIGLLPAVCLLVPGAAGVSALITRLGRFRWAIWVGWGITTCACGVFITFDTYTSTAVFVVALAAFGIGNGMVLTGVNVGIQALSADHDAAIAASMYGFMRSLGMPFGVAISATVYQNSLLGDFESFGIAPASGRSAILASQTRGIQSVFVMMTAVSASALIVSFAIRGTSMDKIHRSIFRPR